MAIWIRGWAKARGCPPPVAYGEGWAVAVGWPTQARRYVFWRPCVDLFVLAETVQAPHIYLKCCVEAAHFAVHLPARWRMDPQAWFMVSSGRSPVSGRARHDMLAGLTISVAPDGDRWVAQAVQNRGEETMVVAKANLVLIEDWAIYDRITTEMPWRRLGLASLLVRALEDIAFSHGARRGLLVATEAGRPLYTSLGWTTASPYSSAVIPAL